MTLDPGGQRPEGRVCVELFDCSPGYSAHVRVVHGVQTVRNVHRMYSLLRNCARFRRRCRLIEIRSRRVCNARSCITRANRALAPDSDCVLHLEGSRPNAQNGSADTATRIVLATSLSFPPLRKSQTAELN